VLLKRSLITIELRYVEINIFSSARIAQLAKTKAITHCLTHATVFSGNHLSHAAQRLGNSNVPYNPDELKRYKTPSSYKVYNLMKLKPQKERQFLILEYGYLTSVKTGTKIL